MLARRLTVLDAPSNLGLRPPEPGVVPGCDKAPGVYRDLGLPGRIGAAEGGVVTAPRYRPDHRPGTVRNEAALAAYARRLAGRVAALWDGGAFPVVLGGDCSIGIGIGLAMRRRGAFGLVCLDGLDYRHDSPDVGAAGGEVLALTTGLGGELAGLDGLRPYVDPGDTAVLGLRPGDEYAAEASAAGLHLIEAPAVAADPVSAAERALRVVERPGLEGFWIHVDADVVDPALLPAVDAPEPGGLSFEELAAVAGRLLASPRAVGFDVTIYDPDLDPDLIAGRRLTDALVAAFTAADPTGQPTSGGPL